MPLFSVIVPVYNAGRFLDECVGSILAGSCGDFELILVDDGSTDKSPEICDSCAASDGRVKVIHKANGGPTDARLSGLAAASGEYAVFVDGDDTADVGMLAEFEKEIKRNAPDIIVCGYSESAGGRAVGRGSRIAPGYYDRAAMERTIFPLLIETADAGYFPQSLWAKAIRRELITEKMSAVDKRLKIGEDCACIIPCVYSSNSISVIGESLYYYRVNDGSITKSRKPFDWDAPELIRSAIANGIDLERFDFEDQLRRKTVHEFFTVAVSRFYGGSGYSEVKREILSKLDEPTYRDAVENCRFSGSRKAAFMTFVLRKRAIFPIYVYSKLR